MSELSKLAPHGRQARVRLRPLLAAGCFCAGIAGLWFVGIRIGASPSSGLRESLGRDRIATLVAEHVRRDFEEQNRIGLVTIAVADQEETVLGFGARRLGDPSTVDANTLFEIGSISKAFTGILLANQIETGEITLDTSIGDLLPKGWSLSKAASPVTLKHLTTHTSGFPRSPVNQIGLGAAVKALLVGSNPYRAYSEGLFREALSGVVLQFQPGAGRHYSNFGVSLLGYILAAQAESDYESLVQRVICEPLGMHQTVTSYDGTDRHRIAEKYRWSARFGPITLGLASSEWQLPEHLLGAGGIRSTGADMLKFLKANMGLGAASIRPAIERSHQELFRENNRRATGMNWERSSYNSLSQLVIWHNGGTNGHSSFLGFTEDGRFGVVVLSNTGSRVDQLARRILSSLAKAS